MPKKLTTGLYDKVFTEGNHNAVEGDPSLRAHTDKLQNHAGVRLLSQHLNQLIERALAGQPEKDRVELANDLIRIIEKNTRDGVVQQSDFVTNTRLKELARRRSIPHKHTNQTTGDTTFTFRIVNECSK